MDSPGLFAPNRAAIFDSQLLAILNLLSSVVIYNCINIIDRSAIEKLSYAVDTGEFPTLSKFTVVRLLSNLHANQHLR
jgi:hypothetical protein